MLVGVLIGNLKITNFKLPVWRVFTGLRRTADALMR